MPPVLLDLPVLRVPRGLLDQLALPALRGSLELLDLLVPPVLPDLPVLLVSLVLLDLQVLRV
ncbi:hypothetical protein BsIDN1_35650 [Bacillus safensis]|uniref:Uncharacterized protein n=1 Tax=Bacillus safensis TaxID=561879 RepID=A0A5S9M8V8_BACIA|nr:hypothetical protein BsIDN1_35650 [Bacillus safensis]